MYNCCTLIFSSFYFSAFLLRNVGNPKKLPNPLDLGLCLFIWFLITSSLKNEINNSSTDDTISRTLGSEIILTRHYMKHTWIKYKILLNQTILP